MPKIHILTPYVPRETLHKERSVFVRVSWEDESIPEKSYHAISLSDARKFVEYWEKEVHSPIFVEYQGVKRNEPQDVLARILE